MLWSTFETQFKAQFPGIQKAKKTSAELQREMLELELKVDELDKTELLDLAKHAKIDMGTVSIVFV